MFRPAYFPDAIQFAYPFAHVSNPYGIRGGLLLFFILPLKRTLIFFILSINLKASSPSACALFVAGGRGIWFSV